GSLTAFNTHTLTRLPHVQALHLYGLLLALLAADRIIIRGLMRDGWWLALWMAGLAYTSGYLIVFAPILIALGLLTRSSDWRRHGGRVEMSFAVAAGLTALVVLPLTIPYQRVAREQHMVRALAEVGEYSATLKGYLAAAGTLHISTWSGRFFRDPVDSFFPGV